MKRVNVIKIGGSTLGSEDSTITDLVALQQQGRLCVVVHGGGKVITDWLGRIGAGTTFIQGERVTDPLTLKVVTAVLAGLVNKEIVAAIICRGGKAVGLSGVDGGTVRGTIKDEKMGYLGTPVTVDMSFLKAALSAGYIPVVAPVSLNDSLPAAGPQILNINADTVAAALAAALEAPELIFLTDVSGIRGADGAVVPQLSPEAARELIASGVATGGMVPKINACLQAASRGVAARIVDGRQLHALRDCIEGRTGGTVIK
jgi:acetylglutamate kinase